MSLMRLVCFLLVIVSTLSRAAVEPWGDSALPVKEGVVLWLDATREQTARDYHKQPLVIPGNGLDVWHDASGFRRDVVQPVATVRPRFAMSGSNAVVLFDGQNHFLHGHTAGATYSNMSLFLFAAPRSNPGVFRAFISWSAAGKNDYQSGLNVDLGGRASETWKMLNVEGQGTTGESNLMMNPAKFGAFYALSIVSASGGDTKFFLDGIAHGQRNRKPGAIAMDEIAIGARQYSHEAEAPFVTNFIEADIAEVLAYNRVLSSEERASVEKYLAAKHRVLQEGQFGGQVWLKPVANPPPVQMLVPGFAVRELPLKLNNINNLRYRQDGKLFAVGYDGVIWVLSDTDGDGLEDKAEPFWDQPTLRVPLGIAFTPPNYPRGDGVFVPAFNKLALLLDTNRDDRADEEIIIATGWPEAFHNADSMGVTLDKEGNIYFGLGIGLSFANAYRLDKEGNGHYDLNSDRGTIYKVSPDFSHREKLVTGIRFPVALAFNRNGDLFCTEQEGATWLANGNPFDELLHIQAGRHYGFPPRHPRHLPNVIDEPSVFDYRPQHQSACGFVFNESVNGGPTFGPAWWADDAIVTGESRGKLWRTKLTKTSAGYVAQNQLIGCLSALTVDATISPKGHLLVCTHGGKPDWGTGPKGQGRIFRIQYADPLASQPVMAWNAEPDEIRVSFDRPFQATELRDLTKKTSITRGKYVSAGDRFETMRPGYQVVQNELSMPRFDVPVLGANLSSDGHTLIFHTPPQRAAMNYAVKISGLRKESAKTGELPQHPDVDLMASMDGVQATWKDSSGSVAWSGWLPHVDTTVSRAFLSASRPHLALWELLKKNGTLTMRSQLNLWQMLQPAVQPGSKLDYTPPAEHVTVILRADAVFEGKTSQGAFAAKRDGTRYIARIQHTPKEDEWLPLELELPTTATPPKLEIVWHTSTDSRERAFPLRRFLLPWAIPDKQSSSEIRREVPELAGGNWLRGEQIFFGEKAACSRCHQARGKGGTLGPDLSNLVHRDYASVMKDITEPSVAINPDHLAYQIELNDGDVLSGVIVRETPGEMTLGDSSGATLAIDRKRIRNLKPSALSIMPEGLLNGLTAQNQKDLLTFLLLEPPAATAAASK